MPEALFFSSFRASRKIRPGPQSLDQPSKQRSPLAPKPRDNPQGRQHQPPNISTSGDITVTGLPAHTNRFHLYNRHAWWTSCGTTIHQYAISDVPTRCTTNQSHTSLARNPHASRFALRFATSHRMHRVVAWLLSFASLHILARRPDFPTAPRP